MAESEEPKAGPCTFLFKKSTRKFSGRKRKASDSDKDGNKSFSLCFCYRFHDDNPLCWQRCGFVNSPEMSNTNLLQSQVFVCIPVFNNANYIYLIIRVKRATNDRNMSATL